MSEELEEKNTETAAQDEPAVAAAEDAAPPMDGDETAQAAQDTADVAPVADSDENAEAAQDTGDAPVADSDENAEAAQDTGDAPLADSDENAEAAQDTGDAPLTDSGEDTEAAPDMDAAAVAESPQEAEATEAQRSARAAAKLAAEFAASEREFKINNLAGSFLQPQDVIEEVEEVEDVEEVEEVEEEAEEAYFIPEDGRAWYVVHCYSGYENKVRHSIEQRIETMAMQDKIFDVVVPTEEEIEIKDGKRRTVERRVFPGYILVQMLMSEDSWYVVRNTPGVTGFVGMGNEPTPLRPDEVAKIMSRMEAEAPKVKFDFQVGEKVRIGTGPFADFLGTVSEIDADRAKVRVMVSFFGRETPVELDFLHVEKV